MTAFIDIVRPNSKALGWAYDFVSVIAGSLFIALLSQFAINLWFTPVPISLQSFAVLMVGAVLGSKRGGLAVIAYLTEAGLGLPFLAGGYGGLAALFGPTGGYLMGFVLAAFVVGWFLEQGWRETFKQTLLVFAFGTAIILAFGAFWLSFYIGADRAMSMGVYPFLAGDILKIFAATSLIPSTWKLLHLFQCM